MSMQIRFYQAECGDAAMIRYTGKDNKPHAIIMDCGYERTFAHILKEEIDSLEEAGEEIDLCVVSHIHDDHIGGAIAYIRAIRNEGLSDLVKTWYYNSPRKANTKLIPSREPVSEVMSISQGDELQQYLVKNKKMPKQDIINELSAINLHGLSLTLLSPDTKALERLRKEYASGKALERNELDAISFMVAAATLDYHVPIDMFDLTKWKEDKSIENASSIAMLTEYKGKRVLWLADAIPSIVIKKLTALGYSKANPLVCDWVKVTHHGSKGNNSQALYETIRCDNYLISGDGENQHCLPTKECIALILRSSTRPNGSHYKLYFTYDNSLVRSMFDSDPKSILKTYDFSVHFPKPGEKYIEALLP